MVNTVDDISAVYAMLDEVKDPEIPVISLTELGVVREITMQDSKIVVTITPTYSGCPAMKTMEEDIVSCLANHGYKDVSVVTVLNPAWTTDWMSDVAKEKLRSYGIAPPEEATTDKSFIMAKGPKKVTCPRCKSNHTMLKSQFGSTPCKALYVCQDCLEPFDYFKCI